MNRATRVGHYGSGYDGHLCFVYAVHCDNHLASSGAVVPPRIQLNPLQLTIPTEQQLLRLLGRRKAKEDGKGL